MKFVDLLLGGGLPATEENMERRSAMVRAIRTPELLSLMALLDPLEHVVDGVVWWYAGVVCARASPH